MKKVVLGLLLTGGFLLAEEPAETYQPQPQEQVQQQRSEHIGYFERIALATQDPHVTVRGKKHENRTKEGYMVTKNKTTIVAYAPWGK